MLATRLSHKNHWISVGRRARLNNFSLEVALTKNATVNEWIKEGYGAEDVDPVAIRMNREILGLPPLKGDEQ